MHIGYFDNSDALILFLSLNLQTLSPKI